MKSSSTMKAKRLTRKQRELRESWDKILAAHSRPLFGKTMPAEPSKFRPLSVKYDYPGRAELRAIRSVETGSVGVLPVRSVMDPRRWEGESAETIREIRAKSTRVAPAFNKGGYVYLTEETDPTTIGRK